MTQEHQDTAVQSMRDQGIADACAGRAAKFWLSGGALLGALKHSNGASYEITREWDGEQEYRSAFAYARAYEAEKGAE